MNPVSPMSPMNPVNPISFYKPFFAPLRGQIGGPKGTQKGYKNSPKISTYFYWLNPTYFANKWGPKISTYFYWLSSYFGK